MFYDTRKGNIYYEVNGSGKPVLLLHGLGGSLDSMYNIGNFLPEYAKIYVDLPCHGKSDNFEIGFEELSYSLISLMKNLGFDEFYLVGISLGAIISETITLKYPHNVLKSAFISPTSHIDETSIKIVSSWFNSEDGGSSTLFSKNFYETHKNEILEYEKNHPLVPERLFYLVNEIMKFDIQNEMSYKKCIIIYGEYDYLFGERMIPYLKNIFQNCKIYKLNAGHAIHRESPRETANIIDKFFSDP
ncbi:MAG: alpha/beta fold hydrolase [Thermoplasmata archaeon]